MSAYFPFLWDRCFAIFKNSQMIYGGYVTIATGKSQTGWVKLNISASAGEIKFSLGEGKKSTGLGFTGSVTGTTQLYISVIYVQ